MSKPSSIDKLPAELRDLIGKLRGLGWTIDQIREQLAGLLDRAPSRSALGRHIQGMDAIAEKMKRSRVVAETLVRELGDAPESRTARLNIELLHTAVLDLFLRAADGEKVDEAGAAALSGDPEGLQFLAKTLDHLARAKKTDVETIRLVEKRAEERTKNAAVAEVEKVAQKGGITATTLAEIKRGIFGIGAA